VRHSQKKRIIDSSSVPRTGLEYPSDGRVRSSGDTHGLEKHGSVEFRLLWLGKLVGWYLVRIETHGCQ
jgi:hypothetical protein